MRYDDYLRSAHWKRLRARKFDEVGRECQRCGSCREPLHVHHINYRGLFNVRLSDLEVLCAACHTKHHKEHPTRRRPKYASKRSKRAAKKRRARARRAAARALRERMRDAKERFEKYGKAK